MVAGIEEVEVNMLSGEYNGLERHYNRMESIEWKEFKVSDSVNRVSKPGVERGNCSNSQLKRSGVTSSYQALSCLPKMRISAICMNYTPFLRCSALGQYFYNFIFYLSTFTTELNPHGPGLTDIPHLLKKKIIESTNQGQSI